MKTPVQRLAYRIGHMLAQQYIKTLMQIPDSMVCEKPATSMESKTPHQDTKEQDPCDASD